MFSKRRILLVFSLMLFVMLGFVNVEGKVEMSCQVSTSCSDAISFKISELINAHAEIPSLNNYANNVCCQSSGSISFNLGNSCTGGLTILKLSSTTNTHVQKPSIGTYTNDVCLLPSAGVTLQCDYITGDCATAGYDTCLATISKDNNAQVADCVTNPFSIKVCCKAICESTLSGTVTDTDDNPLDDAKIVILDSNLNTVAQIFTDILGNYEKLLECETYNLIASKQDFVPQTKLNVEVLPAATTTEDFQLVFGQVCEDDCTYIGDTIVYSSCDGISGCAFYDAQAALVCDNAQPGWIRDYSETQFIECGEGTPYDKVEVQATVTCEKENLLKTTKVVNYKGKLVKMVIVTCG